MTPGRKLLRPGILPVLQTPFDHEGRIRVDDLDRLIEDAIAAGAAAGAEGLPIGEAGR
jgi:dihydrodipicolinate synthase/N-acetylneuraminate lyase